jgi:hypothetical protein
MFSNSTPTDLMTYVRECGNKYVVGLWADFKKNCPWQERLRELCIIPEFAQGIWTGRGSQSEQLAI